MRTLWNIVWVTMTLVAPALAAPQSSTVTVSEPEYIEEQGAARVQIRNHGTSAVTAWQVMIRVVYADGVERGHGRSREGYSGLSGLSDSANRVIPVGGSIETWFRLPRAKTVPIMSLRSTLEWAIFEDNTAIGDELGVNDAFKQRGRERKAWAAVAAAMDVASAAPDLTSGLREAERFLGERDKVDIDHAVVRTMRKNIARALQSGPDKHQEFTTYWSRLASRHVQELNKHSRPDVAPAQ